MNTLWKTAHPKLLEDYVMPEPVKPEVLRVEVWGCVGRVRAAKPPQTLELVTVGEPPDVSSDEPFKIYEQRCLNGYYQQAKMIVDALCETLPGGTIDALLVELLDRKRSILIVSIASLEAVAGPEVHPAGA